MIFILISFYTLLSFHKFEETSGPIVTTPKASFTVFKRWTS